MADLILIAVLLIFAAWGAKRGFISTLIGFSSTIISFLLTTLLYKPLALILNKTPLRDFVSSLVEKSLGSETTPVEIEIATTIVVSVIAFIIMIIAVKLIVALLAKFGNIVAKIPVIKQANSLLGGALGLISGLVISYIVIGVIAAMGINGTCTELAGSIRSSYIASELASGNLIVELFM